MATVVAMSEFGTNLLDSHVTSMLVSPGSISIKREVVDQLPSYGDFVVPGFSIDMIISVVANPTMIWIAKEVLFCCVARFVSIYLSLRFPLGPGRNHNYCSISTITEIECSWNITPFSLRHEKS